MAFKLKSYIWSTTATSKGIDNMPGVDKGEDEQLTSEYVIGNLTLLHDKCVGPIMNHFNSLPDSSGNSIGITSAYRCKKLNSSLSPPGAVNSQHIQGMAVDLVYTEGHSSEVFNWALANLSSWSQMIWEFPENGGMKTWVHIAYNENKNDKILSLASNKESIHTANSGERIGKYTHGITTADQSLV
tara:strand:+ start:1448 stop:2005 length:558 start_codon:yes stop_codon:yes gene_type:complete